MTFEVKAGDVVVVRRQNDEEFFRRVTRVTKTQIIAESSRADSPFRYSREDGREIGAASYSRWNRKDCIVRLATPEQAQQHIEKVTRERARIVKQGEIASLFVGIPVSNGPYLTDVGWKIGAEFSGLDEGRVRELAALLQSFVKAKVNTEATD